MFGTLEQIAEESARRMNREIFDKARREDSEKIKKQQRLEAVKAEDTRRTVENKRLADIAFWKEKKDKVEKDNETNRLHTAKNEIIKAHINELFKTPDGSDIEIQPYFSGARVDKPTYYYHIDMRQEKKNIHGGVFEIPLTTAKDSKDVFPFLLSEPNPAIPLPVPLLSEPNPAIPLPVPLANSVNSILHGWLPIFSAIQKITNWSNREKTIEKIEDQSDSGTLRYRMTWETTYTGPRTLLEKNGLSYNDYNDKKIFIHSWVKDAVPWFELRMPKHLNIKLKEDYQQKFEVGNIQDLIAQLQSQFSVSNPLTDGFNALNNRVARMAEALVKKKTPGV